MLSKKLYAILLKSVSVRKFENRHATLISNLDRLANIQALTMRIVLFFRIIIILISINILFLSYVKYIYNAINDRRCIYVHIVVNLRPSRSLR